MQSRRTFLAAGAVTLVAAATEDQAPAVATSPYDFAAVEARLALDFRHRQVFATHRLADGAIAGFMLNSLNAYALDYREGPGSLHALGVLYGTSVAMLVDDEGWRKYRIDLVQQRRGDPATGAAARGGNPFLRPTSTLDATVSRADLHGFYHDASLTALVARKASFFACDNALMGLATDIAVAYGTSDAPAQTVHADLRRRLVPGTLLVPAGVAAVNQAQEAKFTLFPVG